MFNYCVTMNYYVLRSVFRLKFGCVHNMKKLIVILVLLYSSVVTCYGSNGVAFLPSGFVYLSRIDPSIKINLRYHLDENFVGESVQGCSCNKAIVTDEAADALRNVQEDLIMYGYSLVVYNAYYPKKTYKKLASWQQTDLMDDRKDDYYPNITKAGIIKAGYIKVKSAHSRGSTVDVTIISLKKKLRHDHKKAKRSYKGQKDIIYLDDGTVDMGTAYDFFDPLSAYSNQAVPAAARESRQMLREAMQNHGFIPNEKFWWQFTLVREPYRDSKFDFDV